MCFNKEESSKSKREHEKKPKIACLGLTHKPDIDDLRESPALYIVKTLIKEGYNILPVEPNIEKIEGLKLYDIDKAIEESDIVVFLVGHKVFKTLKEVDKIILDFCGVL